MPRPSTAPENLLQANQAHPTDRYIDDLGGRPAAIPFPESDPCGEGLPDALAAEENGLPAPGGGGVT